MERTADISPCGTYRYSLTRRWGPGRTMLWIMLNPSTADAEVDDPTIRRCTSFARRESCEAIDVVNLYAYRTPSPRELWAAQRQGNGLFGDGFNRAFYLALSRADTIVCGWGALPRQGEERARSMLQTLRLHGCAYPEHMPVLCLGRTAGGQPRHPLYLPGDAMLVRVGAVARDSLEVQAVNRITGDLIGGKGKAHVSRWDLDKWLRQFEHVGEHPHAQESTCEP